MISKAHFGQLPDGTPVERFSLQNAQGMQVDILTLGAIIQRWLLPGPAETDIVLGFDSVEGYLDDSAYIGAVAGRYANRIANAQMTLDNETFALSANLQGNCLHGGVDGFNRRIWHVLAQQDGPSPSLTLGLSSPDGDQGFPGTLEARVCYTLQEDAVLRITYEGRSDNTTVFNPTQHSYFNLSGHDAGPVDNHTIAVLASHYTPTDESGIPTGQLEPVEESVFDLRQAQALSKLKTHPTLKSTQGVDHNWCINGYQHPPQRLREAAVYSDPATGRTLTVSTDMPGMQLYNANFLPDDLKGKNGAPYGAYHALCLETQFYPDSPNQADFPSATLRPGQVFRSVTEYAIS